MATKRILCRERVRRVPRQFSWVDHRLVCDGHISRCSHEALALYLFLITVSDADGLSYYSDAAACRFLNMDPDMLAAVRVELRKAGLIAYAHPLYQVLSLDNPGTVVPVRSGRSPRRGLGEAISIGEILHQAAGGEL
jgi:hypothetical protein